MARRIGIRVDFVQPILDELGHDGSHVIGPDAVKLGSDQYQ
jgi:hypothetical protein